MPEFVPLFEYRRKIPDYFEKLKEIMKLERNIILLIDGKPRTGKSYFAKWLIEHFSKIYITVFKTEEILEILDKKELKGKWLLFDELELEAPNIEYKTARNFVIRAITCSYGFLQNHLIMTCPSIRGIDSQIRDLITYRITIRSFIFKGMIYRKAYLKKSYYDKSEKLKWSTIEVIKIPYIPIDKKYEASKEKMFYSRIPEWKDKLASPEEKKAKAKQIDEFNKALEEVNQGST